MTTIVGTDLSSAPRSDLDPYADDFLTDPFPALAALRAAGPAVHLTRYDAWAVSRYTDVHAVLRDHERFTSTAGVGLANLDDDAYGWRPRSLLLELDPPQHTVNRAAVVSAMTPRALRSFQELFDAAADDIVARLVVRRDFDAVTDLAQVFPTHVFPRALGVDADRPDDLLAYGAVSFNAIGPRNQRLLDSMAAVEGVLDWITGQCQRAALEDGSIGAAVRDAADRAGLSNQDSAGLVRSLFSAGVDTTVSGLAFAVRNLARDPEQWDLLRSDPTLARNAFEETIRVESPVIGFYRTAATDVTIGDVSVPAGAKVLVFYAGANRDPHQFPDPDRFDIERKVAGHVGYGAGPHVCAGMTIARMEGESVLGALATHVRNWTLTGQPRVRLNNSLRNLASLPVHVEPA